MPSTYLFDHCRLTAAPGDPPVWLARIEADRFPGSQVVFLHCQMDPHIRPEGWQVTGSRNGDLRFAGFESPDLQGQALDVSRSLAGSKQFSLAEAAALGEPKGGVIGYRVMPPLPRFLPSRNCLPGVCRCL